MKVTTKSGMIIILDGSVTIINGGNLTTTYDGFMDLYSTCLTSDITYHEAYEKAEDLHRQAFGKNKYSDYHSFRRIQHYHHNKE